MLDIKIDHTAPDLLWFVAVGLGTWIIYLILRNCIWHPLAGFPGPRIAGITPLYKAYIDLVAQSSFVHTLEKLHDQYGRIPSR
jgi:hypothetical protein